MSTYNYIDSALVHGGAGPDDPARSVNVPIYQTSTYAQRLPGDFPGGYEYSRTGNPTRAALESLIAELEGGQRGFAFASGMAALTAVLSLLEAGDGVIISNNVYGGTFRVLDQVFRNFDITYAMVDTSDLAAVEAAVSDNVKMLLVETPANPLLTVTDLAAVAQIAKAHGLLAVADNTFMTPYLQRPIEFGFDLVVHSATKYLGGHSDVVAGLVVSARPDLSDRLAFLQNATGGVLGPFDSFLLQRGMKTLGVRMDRHVANAQVVAEYLQGHPGVRAVYYPGLPTSAGYETNLRQAPNGGVMMSFQLAEGADTNTFFTTLDLVVLAESLGGVESLVCHPATMTHAAIPEEIRNRVGITDELIRLSVGIEDVRDIVADLGRAIAAATGLEA